MADIEDIAVCTRKSFGSRQCARACATPCRASGLAISSLPVSNSHVPTTSTKARFSSAFDDLDDSESSIDIKSDNGNFQPVTAEMGEHAKKTVVDVVIVGAGVVGCAIARKLSALTCSVALVDSARDVAQGSTKSNSGIVHGGFDAHHGTLKSKLSHKGNQMFGELEEELSFGFRRIGSLVLAKSPDGRKVLEDLMANGRANGVKGLRILDATAVRRIEPHVAPDVTAALLCTESGICSPYEFAIALAENAVDNGVDLHLLHKVTEIDRIGPSETNELTPGKLPVRFVLHTECRYGDRHHEFHANVVINCAGLVSDKVAAMVDAADFAIQPRKGEYVLLGKNQSYLARHVIFPLPDPNLGKGILVSPTYHGNLLLGPTSREEHGADADMSDLDVVRLIVSRARESIPDFDVTEAITSYAGWRSRSTRKDFIVEMCPRVPGFVNVAGIESPGLTSSPAIAEMVVDDILATDTTTVEFAAKCMHPNPTFSPYRRPIIIPKPPIGFNGTIDDSDPDKNIICRCERVTESEIVDCLARSVKFEPHTDGVKKRTRAGMGPCQGTFCEERVARLIARERSIPLDAVGRRGKGSSLLPSRRVSSEVKKLLAKL